MFMQFHLVWKRVLDEQAWPCSCFAVLVLLLAQAKPHSPLPPAAIVILLMVFHSSPSPIKEKWWSCTDPSDARCAEVLAMADPGQDFCELPQESWAW